MFFYGWSFWIDTSYHDPHYCLLAQWQNLPDFNKGEDWDNTISSSSPLHLDLVDSMLELNYNTLLNRTIRRRSGNCRLQKANGMILLCMRIGQPTIPVWLKPG
jgi:hypothetical protein